LHMAVEVKPGIRECGSLHGFVGNNHMYPIRVTAI
jgi:hypothetical protein